MSGVLDQLVDELNRGTVKVVDLTQPFDPSTPVNRLSHRIIRMVFGTHRFETDESGKRRFPIAGTEDLPKQFVYGKAGSSRRSSASWLWGPRGRVRVFAVCSQKRDVTGRLEHVLRDEGFPAP